jgi:hypothetical protein
MTLPFKQKEIYLGLAEIHGLLRVVDQALEFEYQVKDTTLGFLDSSVKSCRIPLRIIDSVEVEKKWFSGRFELTFNRIPALDNPFQLEGNSLKLSVKKSDLDKAKSFRSKLMYEILERKMDQMDSENSDKEPEAFTQRKTEQERPKRSRPGKQTGDGGLENMLREE